MVGSAGRNLEEGVLDGSRPDAFVDGPIGKVKADPGAVLLLLAVRVIVDLHHQASAGRDLPCGPLRHKARRGPGRPAIQPDGRRESRASSRDLEAWAIVCFI